MIPKGNEAPSPQRRGPPRWSQSRGPLRSAEGASKGPLGERGPLASDGGGLGDPRPPPLRRGGLLRLEAEGASVIPK